MKKFLNIMLIMVTLTIAAPASAQIQFGVKAGLNITKANLSKGALSADNRTGFFIGPTVEATIPLIGLGLDASLLYDNKQIKVSDESGTYGYSETLNYIDIPINIKYSLGLGSLASVYVATGPQFSFNLDGKNIFEQSYTLKSSEFSWNVGAGVKLLSHLQIGYNYNIGIGKTAEINNLGDVIGEAYNKSFKSNTHQISLTYMF